MESSSSCESSIQEGMNSRVSDDDFHDFEEMLKINNCFKSNNSNINFPRLFNNLLKVKLDEKSVDKILGKVEFLARLSVEHLDISQNGIKSLPNDINLLITLRVLNVSKNNLCGLCNNVFQLVNLQRLCVSNNKLISIPKNIGLLVNLKELDISGNCIEQLEDDVGLLLKLQYLNASKNKLTNIPHTLGALCNLNVMDISHNAIDNIPHSLVALHNLQVMDISHNAMECVPVCFISGMPSIFHLNLSHNRIAHFHHAPKCYITLKILRLNNNCLQLIPKWLFDGRCKSLIHVSLSDNKYMVDLDMALSNYKTSNYCFIKCLKYLNLSNCSLSSTTLPLLCGLHNLEYLNIGNNFGKNAASIMIVKQSLIGNVFREAVFSFFNYTINLKEVVLCGVKLAIFPPELARLKFLEMLDFTDNNLTWLPDIFCEITTLVKVLLSHNQLSMLPAHFGHLTSLQHLALDGNKLHALPESFTDLTQLRYLDVYNNLLDCFPEPILHLKQLQFLDVELNSFNVSDVPKLLLNYETWKCALRKTLLEIPYLRCDGCNLEVERSEGGESDITLSDVSSQEEILFSSDNCMSQEVDPSLKENWDESDEGDSDFEPNQVVVRLPRQRVTPALIVNDWLLNEGTFCPSDLHCQPIPRPSPHPRPELGQFDD